MNRHKLFYQKIANADDDDYYDGDEDDYDYDEDDYDYDEENYEGDGDYGKEEHPPVAGGSSASNAGTVTNNATVAPTAGDDFLPTDKDYSLVMMLLPQFKKIWSEESTLNSPEPQECKMAKALRECDYGVNDAVRLILRAATTNPSSHSTRASVSALLSPDVSAKLPTKASLPTPSRASMSSSKILKVGNGKKPEATSSSNIISSKETVCTVNENSTSSMGSKKLKELITKGLPDSTKPDCTFVIAGHVDAGKSTTLGHLLLLLGCVSQSEVDNNEKNARRLNKESFKFAWLLDHSEEERRRGITIDSASYCFETEHRRIHILDAPGHRDFVVNMISSATQADAALLVVTAATSEFEVGLTHGTKDHLIVLKTLGVGRIVVAVNKMDTVGFSKERYDEVIRELQFLLKQTHFKSDAVVGFCPVSGMKGTNIMEVDHVDTPWYEGPSLVQLLDQCPLESRLLDNPTRLSLQDIDGDTLFCKVESGLIKKGMSLIFMPSNIKVNVRSIVKPTINGLVDLAFAGDTVEIHTNSSPIGLRPGCVGCMSNALIHCSTDFEARVQTFSTLERSVLPGTVFTMVVHALAIQVQVVALVSKMDKTGAWSKGMVKCVPKCAQALIIFRAENKIALEPAQSCCALGRFVLLQDGSTVGGGLVEKVML